MDRRNLTWTAVYADALGEVAGYGYEDNFRAGRIARKKAQRFATWLAETDPAEAGQLTASLGVLPVEVGRGWQAFLKLHGRYDVITAMRLPASPLGIVTFADPEPLASPIIPLGGFFCFRLDAEISGHVLGFQKLGRNWYPLPLSEAGLVAPVSGPQYLPQQEDDKLPVPLSEDENAGRHGFAFLLAEEALIDSLSGDLVAGAAIDPAVLDRMAQRIADDTAVWRLYRINLLFQA